MDKDDLSLLPIEARPYQGTAAGVASRVVANTIDGLLVAVALLVGYGGYVALRLILAPEHFHAPDHSFIWVSVVFLDAVAVYLAFSWWMGGRTLGARVMGLQVVMRHGRGPLGFVRALARAALCAWFPIGLLWCVVDPSRRSVQDIVLRTSVVYNWLPRAHV
jgi:uncharacterized RDD family membrane protein YckC